MRKLFVIKSSSEGEKPFVALDASSGGYPYRSDYPEVFDSEEKAKNLCLSINEGTYLKIYPKQFYHVYELNYTKV